MTEPETPAQPETPPAVAPTPEISTPVPGATPTPAMPQGQTQADLEVLQRQAAQSALQASQEVAVRQCLGALDPTHRTDEGTYADALARLRDVCQATLDALTAQQGGA